SSSVSAGYIIEFMLEDLEAVPADYVPAGHVLISADGICKNFLNMLVQPSCHDEYASEYKNDPDFHRAIEDIKCSIPTEFTWQ
ncbi:hypothetical protein Tco_0570265, partial [Tanacetum coccineum]